LTDEQSLTVVFILVSKTSEVHHTAFLLSVKGDGVSSFFCHSFDETRPEKYNFNDYHSMVPHATVQRTSGLMRFAARRLFFLQDWIKTKASSRDNLSSFVRFAPGPAGQVSGVRFAAHRRKYAVAKG
jgi:hypothetical protein